jgi:hypothetical protein
MQTVGLTLMSVALTPAGLAAVLLICWGLYLLVRISRMSSERPWIERDPKSMKKEQKPPDGMGGMVAVILCVVFLAFLIIVPVRKGAAPGTKFYLAGLAVSGMGRGLRQIHLARAQDRRDGCGRFAVNEA